MKIISVLMFIVCAHASANGFGQGITIKARNEALTKVLKEIEKQSGYTFLYYKQQIGEAKPVTMEVVNEKLERVLEVCFKGQPFEWRVVDRTIVVKPVGTTTNSNVDSRKRLNISGRVTGEQGEPVFGASVTIKGTDVVTSTNDKGEFFLSDVEEDAVLVVTNVSYQTQEISLKGRSIVAVQLKVNVGNLDEAVVVAYNTTTQRRNTGAVTVVKGEQIQTLPNRSFDKSLQGLVPGLLVTSGNGQPGSAPNNFILRGIATGGQPLNGETFRNPLIVVDGVPVFQDPPNLATTTTLGSPMINPMAQLNPSDIESISILKDAAAVSLYGSKASNGVILVTTKKGKAGKTVFAIRHQTEISGRLDGGVDALNQQEYLELLYEAYRNSNPDWTDAQIRSDLFTKFPYQVKAPGDTSFFPADNWMDALYNKAATSMTNEISMSGGNDKSNFYLNVEYTKQNGIVKNSNYDRKSIRFNYENTPVPFIKLGLNSTLSYNTQDFNNEGSFSQILQISPLNPIRNPAGEYIYNYSWGLSPSQSTLIPNPLAATELNINRNIAYRGLTKLYGELKFLRYFTFMSSLGVDFTLNELKEKIHPFLAVEGVLDYGGTLRQGNYRNANIISTNRLRFDIDLKKYHSINILLGQEAQVMTTKSTDIYKNNFLTNPSQDQLSSGDIISSGDVESKQTMLSYFAQANYGYLSKYFLSASVRTDGSSLFGKNERFGSYWSIGGGWIVSQESFLKNAGNWLNYLKLRGSFGPAGNSSAILNYIRYDFLRRVGPSAVIPDDSRNPGNPGIQWESTFTWDAGIELKTLKDRISLTADIYTRKTKNLISNNVSIPLATGFYSFTSNIGDIKNSGVELSLSVRILSTKNLQWNFSANWSRNKNTLTKSNFPIEAVSSSNLINKVGEEYNSFHLVKWAGVNPDNGAPMWIDSTGKPTENFNDGKKEIVGKAQPDGFGSISNTVSWKGLEFSAMLFYQYGSSVLYPGALLQNDGSNPFVNQSKAALNRWQKPGDIAVNPRRLKDGLPPNSGTPDQGSEPSTRYLFKGDFIRLSNINISYSLTGKILQKLSLSTMKLYVQGHNIATWTPYTGQDPENVNSLGKGNFLYPQQRSFTIGLSARF